MSKIWLKIWDEERCGNCIHLDFNNDYIELIRNHTEGVCEVKTDEKSGEIGLKVIRHIKCKACDFFQNKYKINHE